MKRLRTHLLATAAVTALSGAAYAADMGPALKAPPPAPIPYTGWQGFYLGGAIGAARLNATGNTSNRFLDGPCGGGFFGSFDRFVLDGNHWLYGRRPSWV